MTNKGKKIYFTLMSILILFSLVIAFITRRSYIDNIDVNKHVYDGVNRNLNITNSELYTDAYFDNSVENIEDLEQNSDIIVLVKPTASRINYSQSILTKVEVLDVFKGEQARDLDYIYIYEPSNFIDNNLYSSLSGYNIMQSDKAYIFFLEKLKVPNGYIYKKNEEITFKPTSTLYSKYPIDALDETIIINQQMLEKELITYEQVKNYGINTTETLILDKYKSFYKDVKSKFVDYKQKNL